MTAILAVAYEGGLLMAADSHRRRQKLATDQPYHVESAEKIVKTPFALVASAGSTVLCTPILGEVLNVSKVAAATLCHAAATRHHDLPGQVQESVRASLRLMQLTEPGASAEVLIGFWSEIKQRGRIWFFPSDSSQTEDAVEATHIYAAGDAKPWLQLQGGTAHTLPPEYQERIRIAASPPRLDRIPENREAAEVFARSVIEWSCDLFPESSSRPVYCEVVNQDTLDAHRLSQGNPQGI